MDILNQGLKLGRWFRITVVISWTFAIYAFYQYRDAKSSTEIYWITVYMVAVFSSVLLHEFGHCFGCRAVKGEAFHILLWPLGGLAFVSPPLTPTAHLVTVVCGPAVNLVLWGLFWLVQHFAMPLLFQHVDPGNAVVLTVWYFVSAMTFVNPFLFFFNVLLPVYPMDGGRILQSLLWYVIGYRRSLLIGGMTGTAGSAAFIIVGLGLWQVDVPLLGKFGEGVDLLLVLMGVFFAMQSFGVYRQAELIKTWRKK